MPQLEELVKNIAADQYFAVLNSLGENLPYNNLVAFTVSDDLKSLVFITPRNTRKYDNIKQNARVSLLIDNRTNQPSDISQALAVTVIGTAQEETREKNHWQKLLLDKNTELEKFINDPDNIVIKVTVSEYIIASFVTTQRLIISS